MSILAVLGVIVSSAAMIIVLSGFGGLKNYSLEFISSVSPDYKISSKKGKTFVFTQEMQDYLVENDFYYYTAIEDKALFSVKSNSQIVEVRAVDEKFPRKNIDSILTDGGWVNEGSVVIGWGLAYDLGVALNDALNPVTFYSPKPGKGQVFSEKDILRSRKAIVSGVFNLNEDLNSNLVFTDFVFGKNLFDLKKGVISSIGLYENSLNRSKINELSSFFGKNFRVEDKIQQNSSLYKMLRTEEVAIYFIFSLIVVVALFNMFGALIMMVLEKRKNLKTMMVLGLTKKEIGKIFLYQGWIISLFGCVSGLAIGSFLLILQSNFSLFMITPSLPYPISIELVNYIIVFGTVSLLGFIASLAVSFYVRKSIPQTAQQ
jgi:lipoprotein-releasing system permease protein